MYLVLWKIPNSFLSKINYFSITLVWITTSYKLIHNPNKLIKKIEIKHNKYVIQYNQIFKSNPCKIVSKNNPINHKSKSTVALRKKSILLLPNLHHIVINKKNNSSNPKRILIQQLPQLILIHNKKITKNITTTKY